MGLIFLLVIGGILGWLAAIVARSEDYRGLARNFGAGVGGALAAGLIVTPLIGGGNLLKGEYEVAALLIALLGAVIVLVLVNLTRSGERGRRQVPLGEGFQQGEAAMARLHSKRRGIK